MDRRRYNQRRLGSGHSNDALSFLYNRMNSDTKRGMIDNDIDEFEIEDDEPRTTNHTKSSRRRARKLNFENNLNVDNCIMAR
jgi:hypothetical protein